MVPKLKRSLVNAGLIFLYLAVVLALYFLGVPCLFKAAFGIPCPGCGMTHAFLALLKLDFKAAFRYNAMIFVLPFVAAFLVLPFDFFRSKKMTPVWIAIGALFIANWIVKLILG